MANYSLVVDSTFRPFTYQELAAPLDRAELYHEKLAEEYDKLSTQADVLEAMGHNESDKNSGAYSRYKSYSDALRKEADDLYKFGLNTESRSRLTDLRRRYNTDIVPIQNAWTKREKEADDQMKASLQNPTLMFTRNASSTSLDDYIRNPTGGYGVINGANITAQMSAMAKNLEKQILNGSTRREDIDPYTYDYIRKYGLTPDMVKDWRNNPVLSEMFEQVMQANGVTPEALQGSMDAQNIFDKSTSYAEMGMWNAIGEDKVEKIENYGARLAAQEAKERRMADYNQKLKAQEMQQEQGNRLAINPMNIYSNNEVEEADKVFKEYSKYFDQKPDGSYVLNEEGKKEYDRIPQIPFFNIPTRWKNTYEGEDRIAQLLSDQKAVPYTEFREWLDTQVYGKNGAGVDATTGIRPKNALREAGTIWGNYVAEHVAPQFDATKSTEFDYTIDSSQQKDMKEAIQTAARGTKLKELDFNRKTNRFEPTGEELSMEDLNDDKYTVLATRFSPYGNSVMIKDGNGDVRRYNLPAGINTYNENNRDKMMQKALILQDIIAKEVEARKRGGKYLSDADFDDVQNRYVTTLQEAYLYHSQLGVANKTKEQEFNPYGY